MEKIKLTKREYLGEGYFHWFKHNVTGEVIGEECSKEEYEKMAAEGGAKFNPTKNDYTWTHSTGGTPKVNTPNGLLGNNEYCDLGEGSYAVLFVNGKYYSSYLEKGEIVNDEISITT